MLEAAPSVMKPSRNRMVSTQPASTACWRSRQLASSEMVFRSQRSQRMSGADIAAMPCSRCAGGGVTSGSDRI
jgi:hypothetical protein